MTLSLFLATTWPSRKRRGGPEAVDTRGLTGPVPCSSSTQLSQVCPLGLPRKKKERLFPRFFLEPSAGHAGVPKEREPRSAPRSPPPHTALRHWPYSAAYPKSCDRERRGTSSVRFSHRFLQVTPPSTLRVTRGESSTPRAEVGIPPQHFRRVRTLAPTQGRIVMPPGVSRPGHFNAALAGRPWLRTPPEGEFGP
jgi:hypothetical protein